MSANKRMRWISKLMAFWKGSEMSSKTIEDRVIDSVEHQLGVSREVITRDKMIVDDLGADSLDFVELIMDVETEFMIVIPEEDCEMIKTVEDLINAVRAKKGIES